MKKLLIIFGILLMAVQIYGQDAKTYYKTGLDLSKNGKYKDAIMYFSKTIEIDPGNVDAYEARAEAYENTNAFKKAADDYDKLITLGKASAEVYLKAGNIYYNLNDFNTAVDRLNKAISIKSTLTEAYQILTKAMIANEEYDKAIGYSQQALDKKNSAENNHLYGYALYKNGQIAEAEKYLNTAIDKDANYLDAYYDLGELKIKTGKIDEALDISNKVLSKNPSDSRFYVLRSSAYSLKGDNENALKDISKAIIIAPDAAEYYFIKGNYYKALNKPKEAITEFSNVLYKNSNFVPALYERAKTWEELGDMDNARRDYGAIAGISNIGEKYADVQKEVKSKLYEINKESNKPEIQLLDIVIKPGNIILVAGNISEINLKGTIFDQSDIKSLKINGKSVEVSGNMGKNNFSEKINIQGAKTFTIVATDIYNNSNTINYSIKKAETNAPKISIITPYSLENKVLYLSTIDPELHIEGRITDESKIQSIKVDGSEALFDDIRNPVFTSTINVQGKSSIVIKVVDEAGNITEMNYELNKEGAVDIGQNPMGKTWVVFIENSIYRNFPSLDGPAKDVNSMQSALTSYQIHKIIHKKNLTKAQMENFFNVELRDMVRSNQVNSIMIWYSGHGKLVNEKGYWIPVDAQRDDEYSFFDITNLKASMKLYSKNITHLLLVTDACESGSSFYQAMRGRPERPCDDIRASRSKSSQVFASTGYELALQNSQFTKTFAYSLAHNAEACVPIERIVNKVTEAVMNNNQKSPVFGKIVGLEDENGTFFFIPR